MTIKTEGYVRKQFHVDAVQVTEDNMKQAAKWSGGSIRQTQRVGDSEKINVPYVKVDVHNPLNERHTKAFIGDWILKSEAGFKVYSQKAFERAFEIEDDGRDRFPEPTVTYTEKDAEAQNPKGRVVMSLDPEAVAKAAEAQPVAAGE